MAKVTITLFHVVATGFALCSLCVTGYPLVIINELPKNVVYQLRTFHTNLGSRAPFVIGFRFLSTSYSMRSETSRTA